MNKSKKPGHRQAAGQRITAIRCRMGLFSQAELAKRAVVSERTVSSAENNGWLKPCQFTKIASALQVDEAQIDLSCQDQWRDIDDLMDSAPPSTQQSQHSGSSAPSSRKVGPFLVPKKPPHKVVGRQKVLEDLFDRLQINNCDAYDVPSVAYYGMGGLGKTALAIELGRSKIIRSKFDGVLWVSLGPKPVLAEPMRHWGDVLGVDLRPICDDEAVAARLRSHLASEQMLLIIDDVWEVVHGNYYTIAGPNCRTVFTTREPLIASTLANTNTVQVPYLTIDESLELLADLAPAVSKNKVVEKLCDKLDGLPLALVLAGRYLSQEAAVPERLESQLTELIQSPEARLRLLQLEGRPGLTVEGSPSLQAILGMSINRLDEQDRQRFAKLSLPASDEKTWSLDNAAHLWECSKEDAGAVVSRLIQRGLIEPSGTRYRMHAILADIAKKMLNAMEDVC